MAFNSNFTLSDPYAATHPQDAIVSQALTTALAAWSDYISGMGTLQVQLNIDYLGGPDSAGDIVLADAAPTATYYTGVVSGGEEIVQNSAAYELTTGQHLAASDITIDFNSALLPYLADEGSFDLVHVLEHELAHGFALSGYRGSDGQLDGLATPFDELSTITASGLDYFVGPAASYVYGGPVPLTTAQGPGSNYYHVGVGNASDPASLSNDLMYWISGPNRSISALDVAILEDTGIPITTAAQVLIDPYPSSSIYQLAAPGEPSLLDPAVGGVTQPDEVVTVTTGDFTLGVVQASATGAWSINPVGLADGVYVFNAEITGAAGPELVAQKLVVISTTGPLSDVYGQVLGIVPDAATLTVDRNLLESGESLQAIRNYVATSGSAFNAIAATYQAVLAQTPSASVAAIDEQLLADGQSLQGIRSYLAGLDVTAGALTAIYQGVLAQPVSADTVSLDQSLLAGGQSLAGIRAFLAGTGAAFTALNNTYQAVFGQPIPTDDINIDELLLAGGQTIAGIRSYLASTAEAAQALGATYQAVLGQTPSSATVAVDEQLLAQGQTLSGIRAYLAATPQASAAIGAEYQAVLGRAPSAAELATAEQTLAGGGSLPAMANGLLGSAELAGGISAATQAALGRPANAVEIAGDKSELASGVTNTQLQAQLGELAGGPPPSGETASIPISPQTIAGSGPSFIYGLLNNDDLIASQPEPVAVTLSGAAASAVIGGFNPATDIIQLQSAQGPGFGSLAIQAVNTTDTLVTCGGTGAELYFKGIAPGELTTANFRFV